ncbi:MAG: TonB family protein [Candidatus Neomarinimicrobiota bacterium]
MTGLWQTLQLKAPALLTVLLPLEIQFTIVVLVVLALDSWISKATSRFRYALWLVALAKALWPPVLSIPALDLWPGTEENFTFLAPVIGLAPMQPGETTSASLGAILLLAWLGTSLALLILIAVRFVIFRVQLYASPARRWSPSQAWPLSGEVWPPVFTSDHIPSPLTIGLLRPRIYLTAQAARAEPATLRAILYHELAHIRRRDGLVNLLQGIALMLHPLNPLTWIMVIRLARYREQICDEYALVRTAMEPRQYGELLLEQLHNSMLPRPAFQTGTCFSETKNNFKKRLAHIISLKERTMKRTTTNQKLLLASLTFGLLLIASQCQKHEEDIAAGLSKSPAPPPAKELAGEFEPVFVPYDTPPVPIGGFKAIQKHLIYPEEAKKAGVEGMVILTLQVLANGQTGDAIKVMRNDSGDPRLAEAAIKALRNVTWEPALQEGEPVAVWVAVPVDFKLKE